jgi:hypothetical protein
MVVGLASSSPHENIIIKFIIVFMEKIWIMIGYDFKLLMSVQIV